jgi:hypothetical protein
MAVRSVPGALLTTRARPKQTLERVGHFIYVGSEPTLDEMLQELREAELT